jgi:signal transduction histidine kinase
MMSQQAHQICVNPMSIVDTAGSNAVKGAPVGSLRARRRSGLLIVAAVLAPVTALGVIFSLTLSDSVQQYRTVEEMRLQNTARALAAAVDARLGTFLEMNQALIRSGTLDDLANRQAFADLATRIGSGLPGWFVLIGPGPEHYVLTTTAPVTPGEMPGPIASDARDILQNVLDGVFDAQRAMVSDLFIGGVARRPVLTVMAPVTDSKGAMAGLSLSFGPELLHDLLSRQSLPASTFAAIGDGRFRIVAHSRQAEEDWVGRRAPDWIADAMAGRQNALLTGPGVDGRINTYAIERPMLAPGWTVAVAQPWSEHQDTAWQSLRRLLAGGAALTAGLMAAVWAGRQEVVRDARREAEALRTGRAEITRLHGGLPAIIYLRAVEPSGASRLLYRAGDLDAVLGWPANTFDAVDTFDEWMEPAWPGVAAFMQRALTEGNVTADYRFRQPNGSWRWLRSHCRCLSRHPDGGGEVVGYILDVTAARDAEARALASARLASLGEMAAGLAHEMKQPLQSILLSAEIAQFAAARGNIPQVDQRLDKIVDQTQRTSDMIERLRRFARGAENNTASERVELATAVRGALELTRAALRDADIKVVVTLADDAPSVQGQMVLIEQVLSNLLLNARDALAGRPIDAPRQIRISSASGLDEMVQLTVADTGGGIAPEVMARLFEPFVTTKGADKGTGLGLSICHGLVRGMGGSIEARNDAEGAVFTIALPRALDEPGVASGGAV